MKIILKHFITISLLILIPAVALCYEKESPLISEDSERVSDTDGAVYRTFKIVEQGWMTENLNLNHFMNEDLMWEPIIIEEWRMSCIENEPALTYLNIDSENGKKTGKQDYWDVVNDPIEFNVFLLVHFVIAGALLIISGIMTYNIIYDNHFNDLRYE